MRPAIGKNEFNLRLLTAWENTQTVCPSLQVEFKWNETGRELILWK
jgi:hypothetical protein